MLLTIQQQPIKAKSLTFALHQREQLDTLKFSVMKLGGDMFNSPWRYCLRRSDFDDAKCALSSNAVLSRIGRRARLASPVVVMNDSNLVPLPGVAVAATAASADRVAVTLTAWPCHCRRVDTKMKSTSVMNVDR